MKVHAQSRQTASDERGAPVPQKKRPARKDRSSISPQWAGSWIAAGFVLGGLLGFFLGFMLALTDEAAFRASEPSLALSAVGFGFEFTLSHAVEKVVPITSGAGAGIGALIGGFMSFSAYHAQQHILEVLE
eukprot:CAMPEP_0196741260 /NCGR_PEP_ID=MMETSP1091-20130531/38646_1 /TAXON_ID=302021 /ORGANISM="Rhodomonas sp., Strain CCMP768" /LENGTH=130 /DNA_ID=CAMNT_0042086853 /DNA_START=30 /DNA_END=422 /DNA_ORIENTATION=+